MSEQQTVAVLQRLQAGDHIDRTAFHVVSIAARARKEGRSPLQLAPEDVRSRLAAAVQGVLNDSIVTARLMIGEFVDAALAQLPEDQRTVANFLQLQRDGTETVRRAALAAVEMAKQ